MQKCQQNNLGSLRQLEAYVSVGASVETWDVIDCFEVHYTL